MPSRNAIKFYTPETFYHIYNRGVDRRTIFKDQADYTFFLKLMKRYLSPGEKNSQRHGYQIFDPDLELVAFCLMNNHIHLLVYLHHDTHAITEYMRAITNAYVQYFNAKYERVGHLFQGTFRAVSVDNDPYLLHISRYIHLNPANFQDYPYSSYPYYIGQKQADWVKPQRILDMFEGGDYAGFTASLKEDDMETGFIEELLAGH